MYGVGIPKGVKILTPLHGKLPVPKLSDYNIQDVEQFPKLKFEAYAKIIIGTNDVKITRPCKWARNLKNSKIMSLLVIPHLECSPGVNSCVRFLLRYLHGGLLWLDHPYNIDFNFIKIVTALSRTREDPDTILIAHDASKQDVYKIFGTPRGKHRAQILLINDFLVRFTTQLLACKLLCKCAQSA